MKHEAGVQLSLDFFASTIGETHISIPLGIIIGLLASFVQSLGLTIQRKSHVLNQRLPEESQRAETRRPLWLLGFAIFISSNLLGSLVQIAALPVVILAPLGAVSLLWNAFFARLLLGDVFSPWMVIGTLLIAGGAVLIAVFGIVPEPTRTLEDLLALFRRPAFIAYLSVLGVFVVVSLVITHIAEYSLHRRIERSSSVVPLPPASPSFHVNDPSILSTGVTNLAETTERTPLLDRKGNGGSPRNRSNATNRTRLILAISYASFSGILSGMCLIFAKSGTELLLITLGGDNQFWRWEAWMLLLALVIFALLQLGYLHKALILANPTLVCPSAFCFYNLSSILNGLIYFDQFSLIPPLHLGLVVLGIVILLGGVWVVSIQSGEGEAEDWSDQSDEEEMLTDLCADSALTASPGTGAHSPLLGSRSEPVLPRPSHSRETSALGLDLGVEHLPRPTISIEPMSPISLSGGSSRRKRTMDDSTRRYHQRIPSHTTLELSPPLASRNTVSTLAGAGFQIGLAATSPGFAIVPRERRRRVSTVGARQHSTEENDGAEGGISSFGVATIRRRTVSEGDILWRETRSVVDEPEDPSDAPPTHLSPSRWQWLRRTFGRNA